MIAEFVKFIESLKVEQILAVFVLYLIFLWLLVPIWVFLDSKKKFNNVTLSVLLFVLVLPLNIPGLLFYIIIRPNEFETAEDLSYGYNHFNVPVVNFVSDKNDFIMGIELKINGNILKPDVAKDLNLSVHLEHSDEVEIKKISSEPRAQETSRLGDFSNWLSAKTSSMRSKFDELKEKRAAKSEDTVSTEVTTTTATADITDVQTPTQDQNTNNANNNNKKKNKHNKHNRH